MEAIQSETRRGLPACVRRYLVVAIATAVLLGSVAAPARAAKLEIVFKDGLWGAGIGALVGVAQVLMYKDPSNEYYRIPNGAAIGAILGLIFGAFDAAGAFADNDRPDSGALASYDSERNLLVIAAPALIYSETEHGDKVMMNFLEAKF